MARAKPVFVNWGITDADLPQLSKRDLNGSHVKSRAARARTRVRAKRKHTPTSAESVLSEEHARSVLGEGVSTSYNTDRSPSYNTDDAQVERLERLATSFCPTPKPPRYAVFASGWHGVRRHLCTHWKCDVCAAKRLREIRIHLDAMAVPGEPLYDIHRKGTPDTVRKAVRRFREEEGWPNAPYLGVTLRGGGLYLVCPFLLEGVGWKTRPYERNSFIKSLPARLFELNPARAQWVGEWKKEEPPKDKMLYYSDVRDDVEARAIAQRAGLDLDKPRLVEPAPVVADRLRALEEDYRTKTHEFKFNVRKGKK